MSLNVVKCNLREVKSETMLVSSLPGCKHPFQLCCWGQLILTWTVPVFDCARQINSLPSKPLCGKYEVSIIVPVFFSAKVTGGCPSLGCYGYPTHLALVLVASPSFQGTSQSTTFINEIHLPSLGRVSFRTHCSVNAEVSFAALRWSSNNLYHLNNKQLHLITHCLTWHCKCTNILTSRPTNKNKKKRCHKS